MHASSTCARTKIRDLIDAVPLLAAIIRRQLIKRTNAAKSSNKRR